MVTNQAYAHGHTTSTLSTEACLLASFEAEKNSRADLAGGGRGRDHGVVAGQS